MPGHWGGRSSRPSRPSRSSGPPSRGGGGGGPPSQGGGAPNVPTPSRPSFQPPQRQATPSRTVTTAVAPPSILSRPTGGNIPPSMRGGATNALWTPPVTTGGGGGTGPITTGGGGGGTGITTVLPNWATRYNINRPKGPSLWNKWMQHKTMVNLIKEGEEKDYHQLGGYDFMQRFNPPEWLGKGLATGYQYASELARQIVPVNKRNIYTALSKDLRKDKPFEPLGAIVESISNALGRAKEESRLNRLGIEGLTVPQQEVYDRYAKIFNPTLSEMYKAKGGLASL